MLAVRRSLPVTARRTEARPRPGHTREEILKIGDAIGAGVPVRISRRDAYGASAKHAAPGARRAELHTVRLVEDHDRRHDA